MPKVTKSEAESSDAFIQNALAERMILVLNGLGGSALATAVTSKITGHGY
jgi:hypothetical protein